VLSAHERDRSEEEKPQGEEGGGEGQMTKNMMRFIINVSFIRRQGKRERERGGGSEGRGSVRQSMVHE
jgi:hypothetical protein